jgi:hypothetical protein
MLQVLKSGKKCRTLRVEALPFGDEPPGAEAGEEVLPGEANVDPILV